MISNVRDNRMPSWRMVVLGLGIWVFASSTILAEGRILSRLRSHRSADDGSAHLKHHKEGVGTLGYGPPGLHPGFQGFGLGYHLGYGYGGDALGVGAEGGYPFYGGPGYPHVWPRLSRCLGITPFPHYGGPGFPTPANPNYFGGVGPLVADQPVVKIAGDPGEAGYTSGYGCFTGAVPYPEAVFAPFTSAAAASGSASGVSTSYPASMPATSPPAAGPALPSTSIPPTPDSASPLPTPIPNLGIEVEPTMGADNQRGARITKVEPGSPAERAGLQVGNVILSINGYMTEQPSHVMWILSNAAPDRILRMRVRTNSDQKVHDFVVRLA